MEPTNYIFNTLVEANDFILTVNNGEGFPTPNGDTLSYCEAMPIQDEDHIMGQENTSPIIGYSVIHDEVTEKYYNI